MTDASEAIYRGTIEEFLLLYRYLRRYSRQMHEGGISGRKISTLRYLVEAGPHTIGQLSGYLCISDSSTSAMIAALEDSGYVTRTRSSHDNRVVLVDVTTAGRALVEETSLGGIPLLREVLKTLPLERLGVIHEAMTTMVNLLEIQDGC